jgi:hypothetical protein
MAVSSARNDTGLIPYKTLLRCSKVDLSEAVCRPSARLSPRELLEAQAQDRALAKQINGVPKERQPMPGIGPIKQRGLGYER